MKSEEFSCFYGVKLRKQGKMNFFEEKQKKVAEKFGGMKKKYYLCTRF